MIRRPGARAGIRAKLALGAAATMMLAGILAGPAASAAPPSVQAFPTPLSFVSNLDLECYRTTAYTPPATTVLTTHLNPVLADLPAERVTLGNRDKLCVPVAKNGVLPPAEVLRFVQFVDLSCYQIRGEAVNRRLALTHLNRVVRGLGVDTTHAAITVPEHLCVPVIKNGVVPPDEVLRLVQFIDLKCYATISTPLDIPLVLSHLNPVFANLPRSQVRVTDSRQLCVPVRKNDQPIPREVFDIVRWIDLQMYDVTTAPLPVTVNVRLRHINRELANLPEEPASFVQAVQLGLPVAKNGVIPPG